MARNYLARSSRQLSDNTQLSTRLLRFSSLLAVASILTANSVFAAEPSDTRIKAANPPAAARNNAHSDAAAIPECLMKLNLTAKQQEQIEGIIREYDHSIDMVWDKFRERYMKTVAVETAQLAAIEDHLTDAQQKQIREHRRMTAQHKNISVRTNEVPHTTAKVDLSSDKSDKSDKSADKPAGEVNVDVANVGVTLSQEQEATADKIHQKYRPHLRAMNREIHNLHNRLVSLEASKLTEIEQVLTKEQLTQLRANREDAADLNVTVGHAGPAKKH